MRASEGIIGGVLAGGLVLGLLRLLELRTCPLELEAPDGAELERAQAVELDTPKALRRRGGPNRIPKSQRRKRGRRISRSTLKGRTVRQSAQALLAQARGVDPALTLDEYAAARLAASEHASGSFAELCCIVDAEVTRARRLGVSLFDSLTGDAGGTFGRQGKHPRRKAATSRDPRQVHVDAAIAVMRTGEARGIARGATRFFDPRAQFFLWRKGRACHPLVIIERWSYDLRWVYKGKRRKRVNPRGLGNRRTCPLDRSRRGRHTELWIGEVSGVDSTELMLMKRAELGAEHAAAYRAAVDLITTHVSGALPADPTEGTV